MLTNDLVRRVRAQPLVRIRKIEEALHRLSDRRIDEHQRALQHERRHCQRLGGDEQRLARLIVRDTLGLRAREPERVFDQRGEAVAIARARPLPAPGSSRPATRSAAFRFRHCRTHEQDAPRRGIGREEQFRRSRSRNSRARARSAALWVGGPVDRRAARLSGLALLRDDEHDRRRSRARWRAARPHRGDRNGAGWVRRPRSRRVRAGGRRPAAHPHERRFSSLPRRA